MNAQEMLKDMCINTLADVDIRGIYKNRKIPSKGTVSRSHLETVFLSNIGMDSVYSSLTQKEIAFLHLLKFNNKVVDISHFWHLYGIGEKHRFYGTATNTYKDVLKNVKLSFIRKGVLLMAESTPVGKTSKMERWRFLFPEPLAALLPAPFDSAKTLLGSGLVDRRGLRSRIMKIRDINKRATTMRSKYSMDIINGQLHLGENLFTARSLSQRLRAGWSSSLNIKKTQEDISLVSAMLYGFNQLQANEWIPPSALKPLLQFFCPSVKKPDLELVCHSGWEWGCLAKQRVGDQFYYRSVKILQEEEEIAEADYLADQGDGWLVVNKEKIPFAALELLANIATMTVEDTRLLAKPHIIRMGCAFSTIQTHPLITWLIANAPSFSNEISTVSQRYGKQIVHKNLLFAKIQDLSLKVKIERQLLDSGKIISLSKEFIAFPKELLSEIERIVKSSGHVIKKAS